MQKKIITNTKKSVAAEKKTYLCEKSDYKKKNEKKIKQLKN